MSFLASKITAQKIALMVMALFVFAGTLLVEAGITPEEIVAGEQKVLVSAPEEGASLFHGAAPQSFSGERVFLPGDVLRTDKGQTALVQFDEHGLIRLGPLSSLTFSAQTAEGFVFALTEGQVWVNNLYTDSSFNLVAGAALLMPRRAAFHVGFDGVATEVKAFDSSVTVGLLPADYVPSKISVTRSAELINSFLVASGGQATVSLSKVRQNADVLQRILYSKLIKEFAYGLMDQGLVLDDSWFQQNLEADRAFRKAIDTKYLQKISRRNLRYVSLDGLGFQIDSTIDRMADVLTFSSLKKEERLLDQVVGQLRDAEYLFTFGRTALANERLVLFEKGLREAVQQSGNGFEDEVIDELRRLYADMRFLLPTDSLYDVKVAVSDLLLEFLGHDPDDVFEKLGLVRDYMDYAFVLANKDLLAARMSLQQYYERFQHFLETEKATLQQFLYLISEENQIMDNLLRRFAPFYQDGFFAMKRTFEKEWLDFLPEGNDKNEERQTIISTKIDFLKRLQTFFLGGSVDLSDARKVATRLITEIKDLQPDAEVGVTQIFALRLQDYGNFLTFLNTTTVAELRGITPQKRYDEFLASQTEMKSVEDVIKQFFAEDSAVIEFDSQEIRALVKEQFNAIGVQGLTVGTLENKDQRFVAIRDGVYKGVKFSAQYDWARQQVSQIRVGNSLANTDPVRLSVLPTVLQRYIVEDTSTLEEKAATAEQQTQITQPERVARILLLQKLDQNGLKTTENRITITNLENGIFVLSEVTLKDKTTLRAAFTFDNKTDTATAIIVSTERGDFQLEGSFLLKNMATVLEQAYAQITSS